MSDSESDYSDNVDLLDQLIKEENEKESGAIKKETTVEVKNDETAKSDNDGRPSVGDGNETRLNRKEFMKFRELREKQLRDEVFGDKEKFLKNLQVTAESAPKKFKTTHQEDRVPAWKDSDDEGEDVVKRVGSKHAEVMQKGQYKKQLEGKFQRILGTPSWAQLDRKRAESDDSDDEILRTVGHLAHVKSEQLVRGQLQFKRLKDLNRETYSEGPSITCVEFHPKSTASLVAGTTGVATIYSIDGKKNDKLHSMAFKNFPIRCCRLSRDGVEAIFGSSHKYFYTYDLMNGRTSRVFLPKTVTKMVNFEVSPCEKYIAVVGRFGEIHLLYATTKELIHTFKQEQIATALAFSTNSQHLFVHSDDNVVNVYDIGEQRLAHRFIDDGCINGSTVALSPDGRLIATGSQQGVVNVYRLDDVMQQQYPKPEKEILNLTTAISSIKFNHSSEILAIASREVDDAVKLVHFPSATVFSNYPGPLPKLGKPNVVQFSPQSGFFAIGNRDKSVLLYRLKHFNNY